MLMDHATGIALRCTLHPMLQVLLRRKLHRWLTKDAYTIEDLLTAVVLGSACYVPHDQALLPFLGKAIDEHGARLEALLTDVASITAEFWPNWGSSAVEAGDDTQAVHMADEGGPGDAVATQRSGITIARSQPEVVIDVERSDGKHQLILIEAKLYSGKSSHATGDGVVTDQLAKYWLHLRQEAARRSATALAVVYLTRGSWPPNDELAASQRDLQAAGCPRAPLYWLSWRELVGVVDEKSAPPILRDCVTLLRDQWQLVKVRMDPWPVPPPPIPPFVFERRFPWAMPTKRPLPWSFDSRGMP